ncbi:MAG: penicillin-binding protein activator [Pseudomonadota bacterium]
MSVLLVGCSGNQTSQNPLSATPTGAPASATATTTESGKAVPAALAGSTSFSATVALLVPLTATGQTAEIAKRLKQAGELALFEYRNPSLQLIVKDTAGTEEGARQAATAAIEAGAEVILGPLFGKAVTAAASVARPANVPIIGFSNNPAVAGNGVYLLSFLAEQEIDRVIGFAVESGKQRFAGLIQEGPYGDSMQAAFRKALTRNGGLLVDQRRYPAGATGMLARIDELLEAIAGEEGQPPRAEAIFVPGDPSNLPTIGAALANGKLDTQSVKLLGNGGWDFAGNGRTKALQGGWFAAPDPSGFEGFAGKFASTFGSQPPRIASFAYDGVAIAAALAKAYPKGTRYQAAQLTNPSGFSGVDGPVRFLPNGLSERALAVIEVGEAGPRIVSPAPTTFNGPQARAQTAPLERNVFAQ